MATQIFSKYTDAEIDNLVTAKQISPQTAAQIKGGRAQQVMPTPVAPPMSLPEQDEVVHDRIGAMQAGTPMEQPTMYPTPLAPVHGAEANPVVEMAAQQEATRQVAAQKAAQDTAAKQAEEDTRKAEAALEADKQNEEKIQKDMDESGSNWGTKIGQAVAIMMGAYSQGLTGAKDNPAVVAIEKEMERQASARKYSDDQKLKMAEMMYKQAQQQIDQRKATVDSMIGLKKLEQGEREINIKLMELQEKRAQKDMLGKSRYTQEERMALLSTKDGRDISEMLIRLPDGTWAPTVSGATAKKLRDDVLPQISGTLRALDNLENLTDYFGNNPAKKMVSFDKIGLTKGNVQEVVGGMRLEYFGPGILTDFEQALAKEIIGNPAALFSLGSTHKATLHNMKEKMKFSRREKLREAGIDVPLSRNEQVLQQAMQKYPGQSKADLVNALIKQGKWDRKEQ